VRHSARHRVRPNYRAVCSSGRRIVCGPLLLPAICWVGTALVSIVDPAPGESRWVAALAMVIYFAMLAAPGPRSPLLCAVFVATAKSYGAAARRIRCTPFQTNNRSDLPFLRPNVETSTILGGLHSGEGEVS
jgi:hypothetical protein